MRRAARAGAKARRAAKFARAGGGGAWFGRQPLDFRLLRPRRRSQAFPRPRRSQCHLFSYYYTPVHPLLILRRPRLSAPRPRLAPIQAHRPRVANLTTGAILRVGHVLFGVFLLDIPCRASGHSSGGGGSSSTMRRRRSGLEGVSDRWRGARPGEGRRARKRAVRLFETRLALGEGRTERRETATTGADPAVVLLWREDRQGYRAAQRSVPSSPPPLPRLASGFYAAGLCASAAVVGRLVKTLPHPRFPSLIRSPRHH